ncbi:MAG: putative Tellurite resistance [Candidatus Parcubacteria bacterium]|jgi:tellurite methyltransferase
MQPKITIGSIEIVKPRQIIYDVLQYIQSGSVLDLGAGFGRHSLFLADKGFHVTAVEIEQSKLDRLQENAKALGVDIQTIKADVADFIPQQSYDLMLSTMVLHFLPKEKAQKALAIMQEHTAQNGFNVVSVYTNENPVGLRAYLFEKSQLRNAYSSWEIISYEEALGEEMEHPKDGGPTRRYSARLIARKI